MKNKDQIKELYESNASNGLAQFRKRNRKSEFADINEALYSWYQLAVSRNVYPDGTILMEKGLEIAERLNVPDFKASNGWLDRWKTRNNIKQRVISGESGEVSSDTVQSWMERLPLITEGYDAKDIWNTDETGCFWKSLPDKGLASAKKECKGGKKSKLRLTILFFVNALGESECKPIVIGKSENPRCFKGIDKFQLPVHYYSQKKAWMTAKILDTILNKINRKLVLDQRKVLLFMDNAGCHPADMAELYSNIKICFLPPNTTSKLQPLDLGIIKNFKVHYRKLLMRYIVTKIDQCSSAAEIVKSVNVLHAIRWVAEAWRCVHSETIKKCFRKAGILDSNFDVMCQNIPTEDPFCDLDIPECDSELQELMQQANISDCCSPEAFICADDDLPTCFDMDNPNWEEEFFSELAGPSAKQLCEDGDEEDDEDTEVPVVLLPPLKVKSYSQALGMVEDIHAFLVSEGHTVEATEMMTFSSKITSLHCNKCLAHSRQMSLCEFVTPSSP